MMTIGTLLVAGAAFGRGIAPRLPMSALGGGFLAGGTTWVILRAFDGTLLRWGGLWSPSWAANLAGVTVAAVIVAFGLSGLDSGYVERHPVDVTDPDQVVITQPDAPGRG